MDDSSIRTKERVDKLWELRRQYSSTMSRNERRALTRQAQKLGATQWEIHDLLTKGQ